MLRIYRRRTRAVVPRQASALSWGVRRLVLTVAILVLGCAETHGELRDASTGADGGTTPVEARVCATWSERACPALVGCCEEPLASAAYGDYSTLESCLEDMLYRCRLLYAELRRMERELPRLSLDEAALERHVLTLDAARYRECGALPTPVPDEAVVRTARPGDACSEDATLILDDCAEGVCREGRCAEGFRLDLDAPLPACSWM